MVQRQRFCAPKAGYPGSTSGQGTKDQGSQINTYQRKVTDNVKSMGWEFVFYMFHTIPVARNTCWPPEKSQQVAEGAVTEPPAVSRDDNPVKFNP